MNDGYYDPHPLRVLDRPLALIGFMGSGVARTAHALASRQGLPFQELDRVVEHVAGASRAQIVLERGEAALRELEHTQLRRLVAERPCPVIALGDGALLHPKTCELATQRCQLLYVQRPLPVLLRGIRREREQSVARYPEFVLSPPQSEDDLEPLLADRKPGYASATLSLLAGADPPERVASRIAQTLGWIS